MDVDGTKVKIVQECIVCSDEKSPYQYHVKCCQACICNDCQADVVGLLTELRNTLAAAGSPEEHARLNKPVAFCGNCTVPIYETTVGVFGDSYNPQDELFQGKSEEEIKVILLNQRKDLIAALLVEHQKWNDEYRSQSRRRDHHQHYYSQVLAAVVTNFEELSKYSRWNPVDVQKRVRSLQRVVTERAEQDGKLFTENLAYMAGILRQFMFIIVNIAKYIAFEEALSNPNVDLPNRLLNDEVLKQVDPESDNGDTYAHRIIAGLREYANNYYDVKKYFDDKVGTYPNLPELNEWLKNLILPAFPGDAPKLLFYKYDQHDQVHNVGRFITINNMTADDDKHGRHLEYEEKRPDQSDADYEANKRLVKDVEYDEGRVEGRVQTFKDGELVSDEVWIDDRVFRTRLYNKLGQLTGDASVTANGKNANLLFESWPDGKLKILATYPDVDEEITGPGYARGHWISLYQNGKLDVCSWWGGDGEPYGSYWKFDENGNVLKRITHEPYREDDARNIILPPDELARTQEMELRKWITPEVYGANFESYIQAALTAPASAHIPFIRDDELPPPTNQRPAQ
jgi:antitoxin component YwqK of YwqJK toxin-antitoxin module